MKNRIEPKLCLVLALASTAFLCHVSARLYEMSRYSLAFGSGPEPASLRQLFLYASYLDAPASFDHCINKLRQVDGAKQQWALDHGLSGTNNASITWEDIGPYVKWGPAARPWCPNGGVYRLGSVNEPPTCSARGHALP